MSLIDRIDDITTSMHDLEVSMFMFELVLNYGRNMHCQYNEQIEENALQAIHSSIMQHHSDIKKCTMYLIDDVRSIVSGD